jgi:hypothetical protein
MEEITTLGIDLAKRVFTLHGVNPRGRSVQRGQRALKELDSAPLVGKRGALTAK